MVSKTYVVNLNQCKFHYSSNMVIEFVTAEGKKFFRLCRKMPFRKSFKRFIDETLDLFFGFIHINNSDAILESAKNDVNDKNNLKLLKCLHLYYYEHFHEMCSGKIPDFSMVGFPSLNRVNLGGEHIHFLQFLRGSIDGYRLNRHLKAGQFFNNSANRAMATSSLSRLFSIDNVIPETLIAKVIIDEEEYYGTVMDECKGGSPAYLLPSERTPFSETFIRNLVGLEYFDFICYQIDRRIDNYNVEKENGIVSTLSAFDNDSPSTFSAYPFLPRRMSVPVASLVVKRVINRPFMDKRFFDRLMDISYKKIFWATKDFLTIFQRLCLFHRCEIVKKSSKSFF